MPSPYIKLSDYEQVEVSGTTHGTADTQRLFRHGKNKVPAFWLSLEGDVYIPTNGLGADNVDVRSRLTSHTFRILLIY